MPPVSRAGGSVALAGQRRSCPAARRASSTVVQRVGLSHHRDDQAAVGLRGEAEVDVPYRTISLRSVSTVEFSSGYCFSAARARPREQGQQAHAGVGVESGVDARRAARRSVASTSTQVVASGISRAARRELVGDRLPQALDRNPLRVRLSRVSAGESPVSTSARLITPPGPLPGSRDRSRSFCRARLRTTGEMTRGATPARFGSGRVTSRVTPTRRRRRRVSSLVPYPIRTLPEPACSSSRYCSCAAGVPLTVISGVPTCSVEPSSPCRAIDRAREGNRHLDRGLRGLDLDHHLVDGDGVADRDLPFDDLGLGQPLAQVGQQEDLVAHAVTAQRVSTCSRSTATGRRVSRTRSTLGRWRRSSFGGG